MAVQRWWWAWGPAALVAAAGAQAANPKAPANALPLNGPAALSSPALLTSPAPALSGDTLSRIAATGIINLGHREASVPFSFHDNRRQVVGYSHELMLKVVDAVRTTLKLPALTIRLVPVTSQNRIPLVQNGTVDIECGSTSNTAARGRQAAFSTSIFVITPRLMVHRDSRVRDLPDLAGKRVAVTAGTTSERTLRTWTEVHGVRVQLLSARSNGDAFKALETGQADAMMLDDALLYGERAKASRPEDWVVTGTPMSSEVYGCMMRRDDPAFKALVDRTLTAVLTSGEALRIYNRWFLKPIPPKGYNLNWPATPALLQLYQHPSDQPLP